MFDAYRSRGRAGDRRSWRRCPDRVVGRRRRALSRALEIASAAVRSDGVAMPLRVERRADDRGVIRLDREDAGGGLEIGLVGEQRRRALVGGDADILEDERAEQEVLVAAHRDRSVPCRAAISPAARAAAVNAPVGGDADVDRGLRHRRACRARCAGSDVRELVGRDLARIWRDDRIGEGRPARPPVDRAAAACRAPPVVSAAAIRPVPLTRRRSRIAPRDIRG